MASTTRVIFALSFVAWAVTAQAESITTHKTLTLEGAQRVIGAAVDAARSAGATGVIAVVDEGGHLVALQRIEGTFPAGASISIGKARTAALFRKPTKFFEDVIGKGRTAMVAVDFTPLQGGVPILVDGQVVGGIGVSGASSAQQDEELALAGAAALAAAPALPQGVTSFPAERVVAAFAKGMPLLETAGYKIHASRRDAAGQAEVHEKDTDIIHILTGTATFVTGGTVVGAKTIAPEEIRGPAVEGGETRRIGAGDVLVVPNGVPHWFKEVPGPMTYYVVKVRAGGDGR